MTNFLDEIAARTKRRVQADRERVSLEQLKLWAKAKPAPLDFRSAITQEGRTTVIAELKQASPSAGLIRGEADLSVRAKTYVTGGASAISVLTEEEFFRGSPQVLEATRKAVKAPLLRKDFILDEYQVEESRVLGADALLLIAALLPGSLLYDLVQRTAESGLVALVEAHDERDLERALNARAKVIGINNRDLRTLRVDMTTADKLLPLLPRIGVTIVVESGIRSGADVERYAKAGAHAVLVGESLMREADPLDALKSLVAAGRRKN